jgi:hypothetical protein
MRSSRHRKRFGEIDGEEVSTYVWHVLQATGLFALTIEEFCLWELKEACRRFVLTEPPHLFEGFFVQS